MNEKPLEEWREKKGQRGISLILALGIFTFCAIFSVMLLRGSTLKTLEEGELQKAAVIENTAEASRIRSAAKRLQDQILVELKEDGTTEKCVRLEEDEEGYFSADPGSVFPEYLREALKSMVEEKANGNPSFQRSFRVTGEGEPLTGRSEPKEGVILAEMTMDGNAPGYPLSMKLTEEGTGITVYLYFQSASLSYENAIHTEDIYWYESRMTFLKESA